jgi:addiction module HigA family antidote
VIEKNSIVFASINNGEFASNGSTETRTTLRLWIITNMKRLKPAHPGKLLLEEFIKPLNLTVYRVAKDSGIAQSSLAAIVNEQRSISAETAMRLGLYFGMDAQFWLNLQTRYDLMMLDRKRSRIEKEVHPLPKAA